MGSFVKLPAEFRVLIWEKLLSEGNTSIMATSRAIYEDIGYTQTPSPFTILFLSLLIRIVLVITFYNLFYSIFSF
jgi:hypothetical protein